MRYFTRGLVTGEFDADEMEQIEAAYAHRLEAISPRLPAPMLTLAGLDLHDAIIEAVRWEPAVKRLRLSLVALRHPGYRTVTLTYSGALLGTSAFAPFAT
jgi:hypothetical protein